MSIEMIIGTMGAGILLLFFVLNQLNIVRNNSVLYDAGNVVGAILLIVFAYETGSWPFVVLELVWVAVSFRDLLRDVAHVS